MAVTTASPSPSRRTDAAFAKTLQETFRTPSECQDSGLSKSERSSDCQASKLETVSASQIPNNSAQFSHDSAFIGLDGGEPHVLRLDCCFTQSDFRRTQLP
jgi:hypothetical protein